MYSNGGTPATIGIVGGVATVGLSSFELIELASSAGNPETMKVSRRDLPYILGMVSFPLCYAAFLLRATVLMWHRDYLDVELMEAPLSPELCF